MLLLLLLLSLMLRLESNSLGSAKKQKTDLFRGLRARSSGC